MLDICSEDWEYHSANFGVRNWDEAEVKVDASRIVIWSSGKSLC